MAPPCMPVFEVHLREIDLRVPRRSSVNLPQLHNVESRCGREGGRERRERRDAPPLNKRRRKRPNSSLYYVEQLARRRRRLTDRSPLKTSRRGKTKGSLRHLRCRQNGESRAVFLPVYVAHGPQIRLCLRGPCVTTATVPSDEDRARRWECSAAAGPGNGPNGLTTMLLLSRRMIAAVNAERRRPLSGLARGPRLLHFNAIRYASRNRRRSLSCRPKLTEIITKLTFGKATITGSHSYN